MTDADIILRACGQPARLLLTVGSKPEREVTVDQWCAAERMCGFYPKRGLGPMATAGFSQSTGYATIIGRIVPIPWTFHEVTRSDYVKAGR